MSLHILILDTGSLHCNCKEESSPHSVLFVVSRIHHHVAGKKLDLMYLHARYLMSREKQDRPIKSPTLFAQICIACNTFS